MGDTRYVPPSAPYARHLVNLKPKTLNLKIIMLKFGSRVFTLKLKAWTLSLCPLKPLKDCFTEDARDVEFDLTIVEALGHVSGKRV